ncbi:MAG: hypothetical protein AVDCRST_MAG75-21, partial [uncultured Propionibacteriaceae bacterium]
EINDAIRDRGTAERIGRGDRAPGEPGVGGRAGVAGPTEGLAADSSGRV